RQRSRSDDFTVGAWLIEYAAEIKARIDRALTAHFRITKSLPQDESELREVLKRSGVDFDGRRDGWANRSSATFRPASRYSDSVSQFNQARYGEKPKPKTEIVPVTQQIGGVPFGRPGPGG